jgi:hypothetical protein
MATSRGRRSGINPCGLQRVALNIAPAIAPDGTIYSVTRAHLDAAIGSRHGFLLAINPNLTLKWAASLRNRFHDGCGVPVAQGGWLPANGQPGGCRDLGPAGNAEILGNDPAQNKPGGGRVLDDSSSSPTVAPDGSILYGAYTRYNYAQGHLMRFSPAGDYLGSFGFGWDITPAVYQHDLTYSIVIKNNHYGGLGSYCNTATICPPHRDASNPASPEQYFISQLAPDLSLQWNFKAINTLSCARTASGSMTCVSDHPHGFEWCVNAPQFLASFATVRFGASTVTIGGRHHKRDRDALVGVTITPPSQADGARLFGGYITFTPSDGGTILRVPYAGYNGGYQAIQVLAPTPAGFPWLATLVAGSLHNQPAGALFTLQGDKVPFILFHLDHQSRELKLEVLNVATGQSLGFAKIDDFVVRNSGATSFFTIPWDWTTMKRAGGETRPVPNGTYRIELSILKALGDRSNPAHFERWSSPNITIARPTP